MRLSCISASSIRLTGRASFLSGRSIALTRGRVMSGGAPSAVRRLEHISATMGAPPDAAGVPPSSGTRTAPAGAYQLPPPEIAEIVSKLPPPHLVFSPDRRSMLQMTRPHANPPITELARPELKLAGLRIDPDLFSRSRMSYFTALALAPFTDDLVVPMSEQDCLPVTGIPEGHWFNFVTWSPGSRHVAFTLRSDGAPGSPPRAPLSLWVADAATGQARCLFDRRLNTVFSQYAWLDDDTIIAAVVPDGCAGPPPMPAAPIGPKIEDNRSGRKSQARTYADLLTSHHDEEVFEHLATSQLLTVDVNTGATATLGLPRMYAAASPSPDGRFLAVSCLERPFSYSVTCARFPKRIELWTRDGHLLREIAHLPLAEDIPVAFDSCRKGPRHVEWRDDKPATLSWIECQDGGDPAVEASPRDIVYTLDADGVQHGDAARQLVCTDLRCGGVSWGTGDLAIVYESEWKTRRLVTSVIAPDGDDPGCKDILFDRNYEDAYTDPGRPMHRRTQWGTHTLVLVDGERKLLLQGAGASPEGNRPFLDLLDVETRTTRRLWLCSGPVYEYTSSILSHLEPDEPVSLQGLQILSSRETVTEPPQYYVKTLAADGTVAAERQLTEFPHPYPTLRGLQKEILRYHRDDGVELTATLYLPPGYDAKRDGSLPCLMWAYPREFKDKAAAGQLRRSPYQFAEIGSTSPILWTARGWAVLDGPTFPVVAEGDDEPNDTFLDQLTASARAAVKEVVDRGVARQGAIAIGGHSYGAFMAANLLAHAPDLFACGIGRSGAYNRTLTPFSFQQEQRTLWEAPDTYLKMSPFMHIVGDFDLKVCLMWHELLRAPFGGVFHRHADRITKPFLMIHGAEDNNAGTFTMQSERFYAALKGHGVVTRLVLLPHESHGYRGWESVMHTLYEMDSWLTQYCKPAVHEQEIPD